jgi:hypothetical protein
VVKRVKTNEHYLNGHFVHAYAGESSHETISYEDSGVHLVTLQAAIYQYEIVAGNIASN